MFNKHGWVRGSVLPLTQSVVLNCGGALSRSGERAHQQALRLSAMPRSPFSDAVRLVLLLFPNFVSEYAEMYHQKRGTSAMVRITILAAAALAMTGIANAQT